MKKVLIISYYWPPSGGSGVQRWLKSVKYLPEFGWQPFVYTPENAEYPVLDEKLQSEIPEEAVILQHPIWEPYSIYKKFVGQDKNTRVVSGFLSEKKEPKLSKKISLWIRGNMFIPDARKFWIKPSVRYLSSWLRENSVDAIISTGPPHSMHLIALKLHKRFGIPWIADFRDPWTKIYYYSDLMLSKWADRLHHKMEKQVIESAEKVIVVSRTMQAEFKELGNCDPIVITNGFDEADYDTSVSIPLDEKFSIVHIGFFYKDYNHEMFWQCLSELCDEIPTFKENLAIRFIGKVDHFVYARAEQYELTDQLDIVGYVPHAEITAYQRGVRRFFIYLYGIRLYAKGVVTGKIFEYLAARRPILFIGPPDGDAAAIIAETNAGKTFGFEDKAGMKAWMKALYKDYQSASLTVGSGDINQYTRKSLTKRFVDLLEEMTE